MHGVMCSLCARFTVLQIFEFYTKMEQTDEKMKSVINDGVYFVGLGKICLSPDSIP